MITKFGNVMIYVDDPRGVADFWINTIGFSEVDAQELDGRALFVEITPTVESDAHLTLFDRKLVAQSSPSSTSQPRPSSSRVPTSPRCVTSSSRPASLSAASSRRAA